MFQEIIKLLTAILCKLKDMHKILKKIEECSCKEVKSE